MTAIWSLPWKIRRELSTAGTLSALLHYPHKSISRNSPLSMNQIAFISNMGKNKSLVFNQNAQGQTQSQCLSLTAVLQLFLISKNCWKKVKNTDICNYFQNLTSEIWLPLPDWWKKKKLRNGSNGKITGNFRKKKRIKGKKEYHAFGDPIQRKPCLFFLLLSFGGFLPTEMHMKHHSYLI